MPIRKDSIHTLNNTAGRLCRLTLNDPKAWSPISIMTESVTKQFMPVLMVSIAAPTAGLHFSPAVIDALKAKGVGIAPITLHVGIGTFMPVETDIVENHRMETEFFEISNESAEKINSAGRVIAVGTTSTRTLESVADSSGMISSQSGETSLYIYPRLSF